MIRERWLAALGAATALFAGCESETLTDVTGDPVPRGEWQALAPVPDARTEVSVTQIGERIYLLGGYGPPAEAGGSATAPRTLRVYHTGEDRWEPLGEIPNGTNHAGLVAVEGRLYVVGGFLETSSTPTGQVHVYDPGSGSWSSGEPMPTPRGALAYAVLDGRIHTFGGRVASVAAKDLLDPGEHNTDSPDASVGTHEVYDPVADTWERLSPLPTPRNHHAAEAVEGAIVVSGGRAGGDMTMRVTEIWEPATGAWREGASLPTGRSGVAAAALDGWFYLFGGESDRTFDEAERYRIGEDRWETIEPMPTARHGLGAAVVGGAIYVVSGGPEPGLAYGDANERYVP